jgi:hypothetical protein
MRIVVCLVLLAGCSNHDQPQGGGADLAVADLVFPPGANVCDTAEACHMLTCPADQYCYVPWFTIPFCGAGPTDAGGTPPCLDPKCSATVPDGCLLMNGRVECPCQ